MRFKIPKYAKDAARKGLKNRKKNNAGLTKKEADSLGIFSGVERAKKIINNKYLDAEDIRSIKSFGRFENCYTPRCETALNLWGSRRLIKNLKKRF